MSAAGWNPDAGLLDTAGSRRQEARFRQAAARFATGVAITACWHDGLPAGALVDGVSLLSFSPPRVLFGVIKSDRAHAALLKAHSVSLSILAEADASMARRFAASAPDAFATGWRLSLDGPPSFPGGLVSLAGPVTQRLDAGGHSILIAEVSARAVRDGPPLVAFGGAYRGIRSAPISIER